MKDYFSHDYNSRNDKKLVKAFMKFGLEAIGAYWCIVEMLYEEGGYLPLSEYERITFELRTDEELIKYLIYDSELFQNDDLNFWSETAITRLKLRSAKSEKARQSIESRWNRYERNTNVLPTIEERNTIKESKEKEKEKEKENKEEKKEKEICVFSDSELHYSILQYFNFNEIRNPDKLTQLFSFLNILNTDGQIESFKIQFEAYKAYKAKSNTAIHSFPKFLGTIDERYLDGGWNQENWNAKLQGMTKKQIDDNSPFNASKIQSLRDRIVNGN